MEEISRNIDQYCNKELIVKSLVFSAFSITENYIKHLIVKFIPNYEDLVVDEKMKIFIRKAIEDKLHRTNERVKLFRQFDNKKLTQMPFADLRNCLAHGMFEVHTDDVGNIFYEDKIVKSKKSN